MNREDHTKEILHYIKEQAQILGLKYPTITLHFASRIMDICTLYEIPEHIRIQILKTVEEGIPS